MPGNAINFCRIQPEKNFAFIEVRSAEEATNMLALDGVCMRGEVALKVISWPFCGSLYGQSAAVMVNTDWVSASCQKEVTQAVPGHLRSCCFRPAAGVCFLLNYSSRTVPRQNGHQTLPGCQPLQTPAHW